MMPARRVPSPARRRTPQWAEASKDPEAVLAESEQQWLYTEEELLRTPSIIAGMSLEEEQSIRKKAADFITQVGIQIKIPQITISAACVLFNRFLMRYSLVAKPGHKPLHHYVCCGIGYLVDI
jgi:protein BUR2